VVVHFSIGIVLFIDTGGGGGGRDLGVSC